MSESTGIQVPKGDLRDILQNPHIPQTDPDAMESRLKPMTVAA